MSSPVALLLSAIREGGGTRECESLIASSIEECLEDESFPDIPIKQAESILSLIGNIDSDVAARFITKISDKSGKEAITLLNYVNFQNYTIEDCCAIIGSIKQNNICAIVKEKGPKYGEFVWESEFDMENIELQLTTENRYLSKQLSMYKAKYEECHSMVELLKDKLKRAIHPDKPKNNCSSFMEACKEGNLESLEYYVWKDSLTHINGIDSKEIPLVIASEKGDVKVVEYFLEKGADPNSVGEDFTTPLMSTPNAEIAKILLMYNANTDLPNQDGNTALHLMCTYGKKDIVEVLLNAGANVNVINSDGASPLMCACLKDNQEELSREGIQITENRKRIVQMLISKGAIIDHRNSSGWTPLTTACAIGCYGIAKILLKNKANINNTDEKGRTPLRHAAWNIQSNVVRLLLENGADPSIKDHENRTALDVASTYQIKDIITTFLKQV